MSDLAPLFTWRSAIADSGRSPTSKHVALALSLYMNERGGSAFPGARRLAHDTSLHVITVRRELEALVRDGWLRLVERGGLRGETRRANAYEATNPLSTATRSREQPVAVDCTTGSPGLSDPLPTATPTLIELSMNTPGESRAPRRTTGPRRKRPLTAIPETFTVTDEMAAWCDLELPGLDLAAATREWLTACRAKDFRYVDWQAAWKNAMRRSARWNKTESGPARTYL